MERVSINEVSTFRWSFWEDIARYATLGFRGIGVWRHKISDYCDHTVGDAIQSAGLHVSSLQWVGGFTGCDGLSFAEAIDDAHSAIRTAAILRAGCLIVHPGSHNGHTRKHAHRLLRAAMDELVPVAQDYGVRLALEPMPLGSGRAFTFFDRFQTALEFVSQYPQPHLGIVLDLYHFGDDGRLQREVLEHLERLALVQIADRDHAGPTESHRCLPGTGSLPLAHWIHTLDRADYRGFYEFEIVGGNSGGGDSYVLLDGLIRCVPDLFGFPERIEPNPAPRVEPRPDLSTTSRP